MFEQTRAWWRRVIGRKTSTTADRRTWQRYASTSETAVRPLPGEDLCPARVQDVSRGGLRILLNRPLDLGSMIRVELPHTALLACVVHVAPTAEGGWSVGCSVATELSDTDLRALGAPAKSSADSDQRAFDRLPSSGRVLYRPAESDVEPISADIHNISPSGVALRLATPVETGTLLNFELRDANDRVVLSIVGCVVYLREVDSGAWLAGCNFIRELDDDELARLI